ncbi:NlmOI [Kitasatospora sp. NPDC008050]|uniref:NlmOI n=1 Tax=Kitasatospora sp. NPDC008050 TaxID=3364021 RepID=UPI0036ED6077
MSTQETEPTAAQEFAVPVSDRMRDLDFLLGEFRVEYTNLVADPPATGTASWTTRSVYNGHVYELLQSVPEHGIEGRWIFGWSASSSSFYGLYHDNWGNHSTPSSKGWDEDGAIRFVGDCFGFGQQFVTKEEFEVIDEDHFVKRSFAQQGDAWVPSDVIHAYRVK